MSKSAVLEKSTRSLDDLDAFVDESIDAMDEKGLKTFQKAAERIMRESNRRISGSSDAVRERVQSV
jgi:DNA anti-recombination protein RmuC